MPLSSIIWCTDELFCMFITAVRLPSVIAVWKQAFLAAQIKQPKNGPCSNLASWSGRKWTAETRTSLNLTLLKTLLWPLVFGFHASFPVEEGCLFQQLLQQPSAAFVFFRQKCPTILIGFQIPHLCSGITKLPNEQAMRRRTKRRKAFISAVLVTRSCRMLWVSGFPNLVTTRRRLARATMESTLHRCLCDRITSLSHTGPRPYIYLALSVMMTSPRMPFNNRCGRGRSDVLQPFLCFTEKTSCLFNPSSSKYWRNLEIFDFSDSVCYCYARTHCTTIPCFYFSFSQKTVHRHPGVLGGTA